MAVTQLKDGRWVVYYRAERDDGTKYLKREYCGRGNSGRFAALSKNTSLRLRPRTLKLKSVKNLYKIKLANAQEFYAMFERIKAEDKHQGVKFEVTTPKGVIDVLHEDEIVEIKPARDWRHAIGQLLCYKSSMPNKNLRLFLFGELSIGKLTSIKATCNDNSIKLTFCGDILKEQGGAVKKAEVSPEIDNEFGNILSKQPSSCDGKTKAISIS